jgi:hypothetical protein
MFSFVNDLYQGVLNVQAVLYVIYYLMGESCCRHGHSSLGGTPDENLSRRLHQLLPYMEDLLVILQPTP